MKKLLLAATMAVFVVGWSSSSKRTTEDGVTGANSRAAVTANGKDAKYQIIDQEFDNMLAPDTDYDTLKDYELQACGDSYLPPATELKNVSPKTEVVVVKEEDLKTDDSRKKKVTNTVNIYEMDGLAPKKVSSTSTTTVTTSSSSSSSSSSGANGTYNTYNSTGSTSTTSF